jgi:type I restriction enzyme M protein
MEIKPKMEMKLSIQDPIEESIWEFANKLGVTLEFAEYKHVVLSLTFLKFSSDKFEERTQELKEEGKDK